MSIAHPPTIEVPLSGDLDGRTVKLKPWVMGQRAELRPQVSALLGKVASLQAGAGAPDMLIQVFMAAEEEVASIVRSSIGDQLTDDDWAKMLWEDLPLLAQAVWDLNIQRADGGGLGGKLLAALGPAIARTKAATINAQPSQSSTSKPTLMTSKPAASASSHGAGAAAPSVSAGS